MAQREDMGSQVQQGVIARVAAGVRYAVTGVTPDSWFGPAQPLAPAAQDKTEGRAFDYPVGYNLRIQPRSGEQVGFWQLRGLADGYDLLRLIIETRKDQVKSFEWEVVPRNADDPEEKYADQIKLVSDFMQRPDKEHSWDDWLGILVEDLFVIDAICVYPRMSRGGQLYGFEIVDGATVKRLIDDTGRTPLPPSPAYQQVLKGIPAADYTSEELVYMMRNPRSWKLYGYSPVEQVIMTVNIALRRQMSQLEFYTAGNVPEAIAQVPENWSPKQVNEMQLMWDAMNEGNTAQRRKMRFVPSLKDIVFPKKEMLKDEYDEWLARIVCFAFNIPPTSFIKANNRATAEQAADTAKEEGLLPLLRWLQTKVNFLIQEKLGAQGVQFRWKIVNKADPLTQAKIDQIYNAMQAVTSDEVRESSLGMVKLTPADREAAFPTPPAPIVATPEDKQGDVPSKKEVPEDLAEKLHVHFNPAITLGDTFVRINGEEATVRKVAA